MPYVNNNDQPPVTFQDMDIFYYKQIAANLQVQCIIFFKLEHNIMNRILCLYLELVGEAYIYYMYAHTNFILRLHSYIDQKLPLLC